MGVPNFFSWLCSRYPLIKAAFDEKTLPIIDELYLDLNGIIYKCISDDTSVFKDMLKGKKFEEIWINAFNYINEIIQLLKPGKMLFLAFDGVAPRAKMNQQRSRRFKAARKYDELDESLRKSGIIEKEEHFKNNSISPGTEFMFELNRQMKFFIQRKMHEDSNWRKLEVIFSGVDNEGEGEHKIIEYIRRKCQEKDFDPNKSICFYGPDADLIMLALSTHLPNVMILREEMGFRSKMSSATRRFHSPNKYEVLYIGVLREYLGYEYSLFSEKMGSRFNVERIIDDFIFLCFFIGNDFLPRVFCMDVKKGSFDKVIEIFKQAMVENEDYIIEKGVIVWGRAINFFKKLAEFELESFNEKLQEQKMALRNSDNPRQAYEDHLQTLENEEEMAAVLQTKDEFLEIEKDEEGDEEIESGQAKTKGKARIIKSDPKKAVPGQHSKLEESKKKIEPVTVEEQKLIESPSSITDMSQSTGVLKTFLSSMALEKDIDFMTSLIKLYNNDRSEARNYYYQEKFGFDANSNRKDLLNLLTKYMEGLQFVLSYYYTNCPSWTWYFPYHYSPLISDLANLVDYLQLPTNDNKKIQFNLSKPFDPYKQLMLILPTNSSHLLPVSLRNVISSPNNPLNPYYPKVFPIDPFGAAFESEYIALIPFVDEDLLAQEYDKIDKNAFSQEETTRNQHQPNILFEWDEKAQPTLVKSTLPYFDDFSITVKIKHFEIADIPFSQENIYLGQRNDEVMNLSFPSLELHPSKSVKMNSFSKRKVDYRRCCFTLKVPCEPTGFKDLLGKKFYYGYPLMRECTLLGIITPTEIISKYKPEELGYDYHKSRHAGFYMEMLQNYGPFLYEDYGLFCDGPETHLAVIEYPYEFRKYYDGSFYTSKTTLCLPLQFLIEKRFNVRFRSSIDAVMPKIEEEFPRGKAVVINAGPAVGASGFVTQYSRSNRSQLHIEVQTSKPMREEVAKMVKNITSQYESHRSYWRVQDVADSLAIRFETVLSILGSVIIKSDQSVNAKSIYAEKFDVGLNLVKSKYNMLVPELIIFDESNKMRGDRSVNHFFLSPEAKEIVDEYYKNCKPIITALEDRLKNRDPDPLTSKSIFQDSEDPNLDLLKVYIWVLKAESSNLIQSNQSSKVLPRDGIRTIEQYLKNLNAQRSEPSIKKLESKPYDPNHLYPHYEDYWISPTFVDQPTWHFVGDRVVNLKSVGYNFAPFGSQGTVVGILGSKFENDVLEVKIEVLFDEPFIGGTNLSGRCSWGRGAIVNFSDVYNIKWAKSVVVRDKNNFDLNVWDGYFRRKYIPKFNDLTHHSDDPSRDDENNRKEFEKNTKNVFGALDNKKTIKKHAEKANPEMEEKKEAAGNPDVEYIEAPISGKNHQKETHYVSKTTIVPKIIPTKQDTSNKQHFAESGNAKVSQQKSEQQKVSDKGQGKKIEDTNIKEIGTTIFDNFLQQQSQTQVKKSRENSNKSQGTQQTNSKELPKKELSSQNKNPSQSNNFDFDNFVKENTSRSKVNIPVPTGPKISRKIVQKSDQTNVIPNQQNLTAENILSQIKETSTQKVEPKGDQQQGFDLASFAKTIEGNAQAVEKKEPTVTSENKVKNEETKVAVEANKSISTGNPSTQYASDINTQSLQNMLGLDQKISHPPSIHETKQQTIDLTTSNPDSLEKNLTQILQINSQAKETNQPIDEQHLKMILEINPTQNNQ